MGILGWLLFFLLLTVLIFAAAYVCFRFAFYNDLPDDDIYAVPPGPQYEPLTDQLHALARQMDALPYEQVYITSDDGLTLAGRYYHVADGAPIQIQFHGYRGNAIRDFCGGNRLAREEGQNTLVVDQRAHGKSQGRVITFGVRERYDCLAWARYAAKRFGPNTPIFLAGVSMGAATVLMASELDLPENVAGIIADCPYSSPLEIICKVCRDVRLPARLVCGLTCLGGLVYGHFCLWSASAEKAVRRTKVPVLIIHGEDDRFVPCGMSSKIYSAHREKITLVTFPGAGHGISYVVDTPRYAKVTDQFIRECLAGFRRER